MSESPAGVRHGISIDEIRLMGCDCVLYDFCSIRSFLSAVISPLYLQRPRHLGAEDLLVTVAGSSSQRR